MKDTKNYQDYVIKDGKLIGKFEEMYREFDDPWMQSMEAHKTEKIVLIERMKSLDVKHVIELGCGHGHYSNFLSKHFNVLGLDISPSAIAKAKQLYPNVNFEVSDVNNFELFNQFNPDVVILAEISWYILDQLEEIKNYLKSKGTIKLAHLLTTYPPEQQKYGKEYFSGLESILNFFDMNYIEFGEFGSSNTNIKRTYFLGEIKK